MAARSYRRLRTAAVVGCLVAGLVGCATPAVGPDGAAPPPGAPVRVLQLNLCNSGIAGCYTGRSIAEAAAVLRAERPDVVTVNEVCRDDVVILERALGEFAPGGAAVSAFQPARDRATGDAYRCRNGEQYGIAVVTRWPAVPGSPAGGGIYPTQDLRDPEERAWLCLDVAATTDVAVCTTHLAYTDREVTAAQCRYLFGTVVADLRAREGAGPVVVGADLNLGSGDDPDLTSCLPDGAVLVGDGGRQHVVATPEFVVAGSRSIDLNATTDHPGLLVTLSGSHRDGR